MSGGLPYPVSHNRASYSTHPPPSNYSSGLANHAYSYPSYSARSANFDSNHARLDSSAASSSLSGMFHHAEQDQDQHYTRPPHPVDAFPHHQGPAQSREHVWQYPQSVPDAPRARLDHSGLDMTLPREYQATMSHAQSIAGPSHGHGMMAHSPPPTRSAPSGPSAGRSRREKPRLELAPDQPLTTQGKPRTRVYVACVQCRNRKIRCDGAKPICHNCSRRTDNPNVCNYDSAPKRRGPDRIPGARQRSTANSGERPPRRRRRALPLDGAEHMYISPQSASQSPVDMKSVSFSQTGTSFITDAESSHPENLNIIQEVGPGQYSRHRHGMPESGRPSGSGGITAHYTHHNDHAISHTPAAAYEAIPLGSSLSNLPSLVGYAVGVPNTSTLPSVHGTEIEREYGYDESGQGRDGARKGTVLAPDPSLQFTRETWWDALLVLYASDGALDGASPFDMTLAIPPGVREHTTQNITADLRSIFRASPHWMNFINLPRFFGSLLDPHARHSIQPSLILGALALATFFRSHDGDMGVRGRDRALRLRDQAQSALEASLNSRWVDHSLVQAAWLLAFFEICAHPLHSTTRVRSSMSLLDSLLRSMNLLCLDEADPRASVFTSIVPIVPSESPRSLPAPPVENAPSAQELRSPVENPPLVQWQSLDPLVQDIPPADIRPSARVHDSPPEATNHPGFLHKHPQEQSAAISPTCNCMTFTLGHTWPLVREFAPLWDMTPTWQSEWTESDIRKEECRRLVWSSVMLSAGHSSYTAASSDIETQQLFLMDPRNYALLFPGESLTRVDDSPAIPPPAKNSVWALYMRAMLLWNSCIRMRSDSTLSDADKAQFALNAWTEIDAIEQALGRHTCGIERAFLFQGRELLFNSRMCIAYEFQRCLPQPTAQANLLFYRRMAEEWLQHQASLAKHIVDSGLPSVTGMPAANLAKRPFLLFWFMSQIERALTLWSYDQTLSIALDVAKALSRPVEWLMALWPCPEQRRRWEELHERLDRSCLAAAVPAPSSDSVPAAIL